MECKECLTETGTSASCISYDFIEIVAAHSPNRSLMIGFNFLLDQLWVLLVVCLLKSIAWDNSVTVLACRKQLENSDEQLVVHHAIGMESSVQHEIY